ncbi:MAG: ParA family protein [Trueperaceae bacterium]
MSTLITAEEFAAQQGYTARRIRQLATEGRIQGAEKHGRDWLFEPRATILSPRTFESLRDLVRLQSAPTGCVIAGLYNQAGGAGKTTLSRDLGYLAALWGLRVLLIDLDSQANLTSWLGIKGDVPLEETIYPFVVQRQSLPFVKSVFGLDLIPASLNVDFASQEIEIDKLERTDLRERLPLASYDLILLDVPPSITNLLLVMLRVADKLIVPVATENKGIKGMKNVSRLLEMHRDLNPQIRVSCYVPTRFDPTVSEAKIYLEALETTASHPVSPPLHLRISPYMQATSDGTPVPHLFPAGAVTTELVDVAKFVFKNLGLGVQDV